MTRRAGDGASVFGAVAAQYAAGRPGYPDAAVDWLLPPRALDVLDLAAGTGKLTRSLVRRALRVVAVEPSDPMRAALTAALPGVDARPGTAEATGLPDACVDAVVVGQAWHWFDEPAAAVEVARVLRPGGRLGVVWNDLDESDPWTARLVALMHSAVENPSDLHEREPRPGEAFGPVGRLSVPWVDRVDAAALRALVASRSYVVRLTADARDQLLRHVDDLAAEAGDDLAVAYRTRCFRADLR